MCINSLLQARISCASQQQSHAHHRWCEPPGSFLLQGCTTSCFVCIHLLLLSCGGASYSVSCLACFYLAHVKPYMSQRVQVARSQEAVNDKLHMLEMHQKGTHDSLLQMEKTASSMYQVWIQLLSLQFHCGHVKGKHCRQQLAFHVQILLMPR